MECTHRKNDVPRPRTRAEGRWSTAVYNVKVCSGKDETRWRWLSCEALCCHITAELCACAVCWWFYLFFPHGNLWVELGHLRFGGRRHVCLFKMESVAVKLQGPPLLRRPLAARPSERGLHPTTMSHPRLSLSLLTVPTACSARCLWG